MWAHPIRVSAKYFLPPLYDASSFGILSRVNENMRDSEYTQGIYCWLYVGALVLRPVESHSFLLVLRCCCVRYTIIYLRYGARYSSAPNILIITSETYIDVCAVNWRNCHVFWGYKNFSWDRKGKFSAIGEISRYLNYICAKGHLKLFFFFLKINGDGGLNQKLHFKLLPWHFSWRIILLGCSNVLKKKKKNSNWFFFKCFSWRAPSFFILSRVDYWLILWSSDIFFG